MSKVIVKQDSKGIPTLYIDGVPFFMRSGEIHNSAASSIEIMREKIWPQVRGLNLNSLIVPVYWECIEPVQGMFDFELVDQIILDARKEGLKLCLLWFGLWKNAESMYVPSWVKRDSETFFRVKKVNGEATNTISPLCSAAVDADKMAFCRLMEHIKEFDEDASTVIVIQVENEMGLLGTDRDYSANANELFSDSIPSELSDKYNVTGSWKTAFRDDAEEYFMAYHFAKAVEHITAAGKKIYDIPCYTNAWLKQYPWFAGSYPSGGPVRSVHDIWKMAAPSLFTLAPDIYVPYCADVMDEYAYADNTLFIPEIRKDAVASSYCLYAFLHHNAICFSPFGIEELSLSPDEIDMPPMEVMIALNIDPSAFDITGSKEILSTTYGLLQELEPLYLEYRGTDKLKSCIRHGEYDYGNFLRFSDYDFQISYSPRQSGKPLGNITIFEISENRFLIIGMESTVTIKAKPYENLHPEFLSLEDGMVVNGKWKSSQRLNGDEKMALKFGSFPKACMVELFKY